jgi:group I intron endonuclease
MEKINYIYHFFNTQNGKIYIGKTNNIKRRLKHHYNVSSGGKLKYKHHFQAIHAALKKYGNIIEFSIIQTTSSEKEANICETYWINYFSSNNPKFGYNLTAGGDGTSRRFVSQETRNKMSKSATGKKHSDTAKMKLSLFHSGKILTEEHKKKISIGNKGKTLSKKHIQSIINANTGKIISESTKLKISESLIALNLNGENNPNSLLSNNDVKKIRELYSTGNYTQKKLSIMFNIHQTSISLIVNNKNHKNDVQSISKSKAK